MTSVVFYLVNFIFNNFNNIIIQFHKKVLRIAFNFFRNCINNHIYFKKFKETRKQITSAIDKNEPTFEFFAIKGMKSSIVHHGSSPNECKLIGQVLKGLTYSYKGYKLDDKFKGIRCKWRVWY